MKKWICFLLAVITCVCMVTPAQAAVVPTYKVNGPKWVTIDGKVSEKEWGKPIYKGVSLQAAQDGTVDTQVTAWWFDASNNQDTTFDLYVTNNDYGVAFACVVHNVPPEDSTDTTSWRLMSFGFSFSKWEPWSCVEIKNTDGVESEVYSAYRLQLLQDGRLKDTVLSQGTSKWNLYRGYEYQIKYDVTTHSITYEVIVPYAYTNLDLSKSNEMAFSALISLNRDGNTVNGAKNGSNRFLIGTGTANAGAGKISHRANCIRIQLATNQDITKYIAENETITDTPHKLTHDEVVEMYQGPRFDQQENNEKSMVQWLVVGASALIVLVCTAVIILTVVSRKKKSKAEKGSDGQ